MAFKTEVAAALSRGAVVRFADRFRGQSDATGIDPIFFMRGGFLNDTTKTANTSDLLHLPVDSSFWLFSSCSVKGNLESHILSPPLGGTPQENLDKRAD